MIKNYKIQFKKINNKNLKQKNLLIKIIHLKELLKKL